MSRDCPPHSPASSVHDDSDNETQGNDTQRCSSPKRVAPYPSAVPTSQGSEVSATSSTAPSPDSRSSRLIGVSDILNPSPHLQHGAPRMPVKRHADEAHFETPQRISTTPQKPPSTKSLPPSPIEQGDVLERLPPHGTFPRHVRHPVAPSSRMAGGPRVGLQTSPYSGAPAGPPHHFAPSLTSPLQTTYHESLPSPSAVSHPHQPGSYPFPHYNGRSGPPSHTGSPSSVAHHHAFAHPAQRHQHPLMTPPMASYNQTSPQFPPHHSYSAPNSATSPTATSSFPVMHLETAEGQITIPIDTTAASKIADEKRKRNAGASARFRQRRKEREREMSARISELELRLKVVEQERDHYRNLALKYAGTPLPNTAHVVPPPNGPRPNTHGLQLSPRLMSMANSQPLQNLPPFTSPAYGNGRGDSRISPVGDMTRSLSSEASVMGRTNGHGASHVGLGVRGIGSMDSIRDMKREVEERSYDGGDTSRRSSFAADHERTYTHMPRERHYHQEQYFNGVQDWQHRPIERH